MSKVFLGKRCGTALITIVQEGMSKKDKIHPADYIL